VPKMKTVHIESASPLNPLGIKGLGEGGAIAPPAAIANALADALRPLTVRVNEIPLRPSRVLELLSSKGKNLDSNPSRERQGDGEADRG
jgi:aerobic carbon-monoxide dehydrogenase large subunit